MFNLASQDKNSKNCDKVQVNRTLCKFAQTEASSVKIRKITFLLKCDKNAKSSVASCQTLDMQLMQHMHFVKFI